MARGLFNAPGFRPGRSPGDGGWGSADRFTEVAHLVGWHNHAGSTEVTNWSDDGNKLATFSRRHRAWIAVNNQTASSTVASGPPGLRSHPGGEDQEWLLRRDRDGRTHGRATVTGQPKHSLRSTHHLGSDEHRWERKAVPSVPSDQFRRSDPTVDNSR